VCDCNIINQGETASFADGDGWLREVCIAQVDSRASTSRTSTTCNEHCDGGTAKEQRYNNFLDQDDASFSLFIFRFSMNH